ncbi:MAG: 23S rRNA (adenine(2503)-C(2))-methyltransferase RlmN [Chitinispirillaceae bacterium]|jgi:23S rRNA (adenine2503-C2)-methyltransferase|nr:23S rRNA (adenine(2503)-C(2))-methyltransferase RlmN [Chitinispirillaceae bacterium]
MMTEKTAIRLKNLAPDALQTAITAAGEPAFRAQQIIKWLYQKRVDCFSAMKNVSGATREKFSRDFYIGKLALVKLMESPRGDAVKFGFRLIESDHTVECVLLVDGERRTACLSSQLGCGLGCTFCQTGRMGLIRNLTQDEILGQLIGINDYLAEKSGTPVTNIVFMGMGEALSNFDNFRSSLAVIMNEHAFGIGARRITVSTAGVVPSIERLLKENLTIGLAISLNSFSNEQRSAVMPINKKYPIESLVAVAKRYVEKTGRRVTFEYVLIAGETDTPAAAKALKKLLGAVSCKINCIPVNPVSGSGAAMPSRNRQHAFVDMLSGLGLTATLRSGRGRDIAGACGQLTAESL